MQEDDFTSPYDDREYPRRPRWKRALAITGIVIGSLIVLLVLAALIADPLIERYAQRRVADLQQQLDRPVRARVIDVTLLRGRVHVRDLFVGPGKGEPKDAAALRVPEANVNVGVWRTLLSLGKSPYIESIEVRGSELNVVKRPDGTLNWERISQRLSEKEKERARKPEQRGRERERKGVNAKVASFKLDDANVHFVDMSAGRGGRGARASISDIDARGKNLGSRGGGELTAEADVLGASRNAKMHAVLGQAKGNAAPPIKQLALDVQPVELAPLAPFFATRGQGAGRFERGVFSSSLHANEQSGGTLTQGWLALARARFSGGKSFDARLDVDATRDAKAGRTNIRKLALSLADMKLVASGELREAKNRTRFQQFALRSEKLNFDGIRKIYPAFDAKTAPVRLDGGVALNVTGSGDAQKQNGVVDVQLADAVVDVPDKFHKPSGTPMALQARFRTTQDTADIDSASLQLADFEVRGKGQVKDLDRDSKRYTFEVTTPKPAVASVLRLLPPIARARGGGDLPGKLFVDARFERNAQHVTADGTLRVSEMNVDVPGARFKGGGNAKFSIRGTKRRSTGQLDADFTQLAAMYQDVVQKPENTPFRINAKWKNERDRTRADVRGMVASMPVDATVALSGRAPNRSFSADVKMPEFEVRPLVAMLPGASKRPIGDVRFGGDLKASGVTGRPQALEVDVPHFTARAGKSAVTGKLSAKNLENPKLDVVARADYLDTSEFVPEAKSEEKAPEESARPSFLAKADGKLDVAIKKGKISDIPVDNLKAQLDLRDGRATAKVLEVDAFGGKLSGSGTEVPVASGRGPVRIKGEARQMQVDAVTDRFVQNQNLLRGAMSAKIDVSSKDMSVESVKHSLTGHMEGKVAGAEFLPANGYGQLAEQVQAAAKAPQLKKALGGTGQRVAKAANEKWELQDLRGALEFKDGAVLIPKPLTAETPDGKLSVGGRASLGDAGDLDGTLELSPKAVSELTDGKAKFDKPVPVPFSVEGSLTRPRFGFEVERIIEPIAKEEIGDVIEHNAPKGSKKQSKKAVDQIEKGLRKVF
jgi:hypothetical protein